MDKKGSSILQELLDTTFLSLMMTTLSHILFEHAVDVWWLL